MHIDHAYMLACTRRPAKHWKHRRSCWTGIDPRDLRCIYKTIMHSRLGEVGRLGKLMGDQEDRSIVLSVFGELF